MIPNLINFFPKLQPLTKPLMKRETKSDCFSVSLGEILVTKKSLKAVSCDYWKAQNTSKATAECLPEGHKFVFLRGARNYRSPLVLH